MWYVHLTGVRVRPSEQLPRSDERSSRTETASIAEGILSSEALVHKGSRGAEWIRILMRQVSDCAAEGLKAVMALQSIPGMPQMVSRDRMRDNIDTLLSMQNPNGGYASYELQRAGEWMELLNAAEVFGGIMVDYMYPEFVVFAWDAVASWTRSG